MSRHLEIQDAWSGGNTADRDGAEGSGFQARDLVAGPDHAAWAVVEERKARDAELEARFGQIEVGAEDMLWLAEYGDPDAFQKFGRAFLRIVDQRAGSTPDEVALPLENAGS